MKLQVISSRTAELESGNLPLPAVLGRGVDATVRFLDPWASRQHCRIEISDGSLVVRDLNSKHGTFVNGRQIKVAVLEPGDEIAVGMTRILVADDSDANQRHLPELTIETPANVNEPIVASTA